MDAFRESSCDFVDRFAASIAAHQFFSNLLDALQALSALSLPKKPATGESAVSSCRVLSVIVTHGYKLRLFMSLAMTSGPVL